jgi:dUTP pyrophosphatase
MKVKIKRFDKSLPLPVYKTKGAAAVDLYTRIEVVIESHQIVYIPMNVAIEVPPKFFAMMVPRSSTHKLGIMSANGIGVMDSDFCGDNDEYHFIVYNFTDNPVTIEKGTRLCQVLLIKCENFDFEEVDKMENSDRGGIGSTGVK